MQNAAILHLRRSFLLRAAYADCRRGDNELHVFHVRVAGIDKGGRLNIRAGLFGDHVVDLLIDRIVNIRRLVAEFTRTILHFLRAVQQLIHAVRVILQAVIEFLHVIQLFAQIGKRAVRLAVFTVFLERLRHAVQIFAALALLFYFLLDAVAHLVGSHLRFNVLVDQAAHLAGGHLRLDILADQLLHLIGLHLLLDHAFEQRLRIP